MALGASRRRGVAGRARRAWAVPLGVALATVAPVPAPAQGAPAPTARGAADADTPALDWQQARQRLLQVADALAAADAGVEAKEHLQDASRYLRLPEITVDVRRMHFEKTLALPLGSLAPVAEAFGIPSPLEFSLGDWRTRPVATAFLPLYSGGLIPAAQAAARGASAQARAERDAQRQALELQLVQAYFGQRLAEQALAVRREVLDGLDRHVDAAGKLERAGFATRAQRLQATVARDKAARDYHKAVNDLDTLQQALATLLRSGGPVRAASPLFVIEGPIADRASFERTALAGHPQVERLQALLAQAEQGVRVQQARLKPQVYLFGQYDLHRRDALLTDPDWAYGIGVRYTLVSPSARPLQVSAARAQEAQARFGLEEARSQLRLGLDKAWNELETARTQFRLLTSSIAQAGENLRLQELAYREGQATSLDVIDARLALGGAKVEQAQAAYEFDMALARLLETGGQLDRFDDWRRKATKVLE